MRTDPAEDLRLIQATLDGHPDAFRDLMGRYQDYIYDLAWRMTGSSEEAEDISQETFLRIWKNLHRYRPAHKFSTWAYTICLNLCRKHQSRRRWFFWRRPAEAVEEDAEGSPIPEPADRDPLADPARRMETRQNAEAIRDLASRCVAALPSSLRQVFVLRHLHDLSYEEIAEATGLSLEAVKMRLHRGRRFLFERFREPFEALEK